MVLKKNHMNLNTKYFLSLLCCMNMLKIQWKSLSKLFTGLELKALIKVLIIVIKSLTYCSFWLTSEIGRQNYGIVAVRMFKVQSGIKHGCLQVQHLWVMYVYTSQNRVVRSVLQVYISGIWQMPLSRAHYATEDLRVLLKDPAVAATWCWDSLKSSQEAFVISSI